MASVLYESITPSSSMMIRKILVFLLFWSFTMAAADKEHVSAMVGGVGSLRCAVDRGKCGEVHSLKWYRGEQRIYVFSETGGVARKEGDMSDRLEVVHESNSSAAELRISPVRSEDEGVFRCELTYVLVGEDCVTVQLLHFRTLMKPSSVKVVDGTSSAIQNGTTLGPYAEGAELKLECIVSGGRPVPRVVWTIRNKEIAGVISATEMFPDSGHEVSNTIKIVLTRAELASQLQCEVFSDALDESVKIQMDIDINLRPTKISLSGVDKHAVQGDKVSLECLVQGARPAANLTWYNGSQSILPENVDTITNIQADGTFDTQSSLSFWATRFENGVTFRCDAENIVSREETDKPLHATKVLEVFYAPVVTVHPNNITVNETSNILLFCEYEANPASLTGVTWVQNGHDLNLGIEPWRYEGGTTDQQSLLIKNSSGKDLGTYECRLNNSVGSSLSPTSIRVDVHHKPEVKVWMEPPGPVIESERKNVTLHCEVVSGNPPILARARWFLDGDLLKQLPDCNTTKDPDESSPVVDVEDMCEDIDPSRLLLQQTSRGFHGNYSCEGGNSAGWGPVSQRTELLVYYEPGPATLTYTPIRVIKGHTLILTCSVEDLGRPLATRYQWYRGSRTIKEIITPTWTIEPVSLETSSNFTCRAVNDAGMGESATVFIEVLAPPAFINNIPPYSGVLYNSKNVKLSCRIECSPPCTVQWLKDGRPISPSAPYFQNDTAIAPDTSKNDFESVHSTLIWNMTLWSGGVLDRHRDNGNYTCRSSENGVGPGVTSSTLFGVEYPPENIGVSNKVVSVIENTTPDKAPEVTCYAKSKPDPYYEWRRSNTSNPSGKSVHTSFDTLQQKTKDGLQSKIIFNKPVQRSESGDIICEAMNKHGSTSTTTYLNVKYKPECGITQTEKEGYQVLVCTANANPTDVTFMWRLKNENDSLGSAESIKQRGLQSILKLDPTAQHFRTYLCVATNEVGSSVPCERDVAANLDKITGSITWWRRLEHEPLFLAGAAAGILLLMLLLCIPLICLCRRRNSDKYNNPVEIEERENVRFGEGRFLAHINNATQFLTALTPDVLRLTSLNTGGAAGGASGTSVSDERDTYQNLTFHGLQHVPHTKNTNLQQQQFTQNSNFIQNNSIKSKGKKQFQIPAQDHHSFCYFQPTQSDNQCGNNVQSLPEHGSYDPQFYSKTLDRNREKSRQKSSRMKKSESLREKLSCVGSHSTDSFDRRSCRSNLNDFLSSNSEAPSYFQHLLKNNTNPQRNYPPSYSYTMSSLNQHRHSKDSGGKNSKESKSQKRLVYADLALTNHNMKFKNTVHSNRQLYGNFALTEHETVDGTLTNNQRYGEVVSCNNNQRKNNQSSRNSEQGSLKYNEIDV